MPLLAMYQSGRLIKQSYIALLLSTLGFGGISQSLMEEQEAR